MIAPPFVYPAPNSQFLLGLASALLRKKVKKLFFSGQMRNFEAKTGGVLLRSAVVRRALSASAVLFGSLQMFIGGTRMNCPLSSLVSRSIDYRRLRLCGQLTILLFFGFGLVISYRVNARVIVLLYPL